MHMTVPPNFRRRIETPQVLCLHYAHLEQFEIEERQGYRVTVPLRTLIDVVIVGTVADNFVAQSVRQALERGLVAKEELEALESTHSDIYQKIKRLFHDEL